MNSQELVENLNYIKYSENSYQLKKHMYYGQLQLGMTITCQ